MDAMPYTLDEMTDIASKVEDWQYRPLPGSFCGYRGVVDNYVVDISHFEVPRGISPIEGCDTWYNKLRNSVLKTVPLLGYKDTVYVQVAEVSDGAVVRRAGELGDDPELVDVMLRAYDQELASNGPESWRIPYLKERLERAKE